MTELQRFYPEADGRLPAIAALPEGPRATGGDWTVAVTGRALWAARGDAVWRLPVLGPWTVHEAVDGVLAWSGSGVEAWFGPDGPEVWDDPRERRGRRTVVRRAPGGPWSWVDGPALPQGARWARSLRPSPLVAGVAWADSGFVYRWDGKHAPQVLGPGRELHFDASGRPRPGPAPLSDPPVRPEPPGDAEPVRTTLAGLRVRAVRREGTRLRGWCGDGTVVLVAHSSAEASGSSTSGSS